MGQKVDARDVLDTNARTRRTVPAVVLGFFRPSGPNPSDDYEFVSQTEEPTEISPGLDVQLEHRGAQFRVRRRGQVLRCRWAPTSSEVERAGSEAPSALRRLFAEEYLQSFTEQAGKGEASVIVSKLTRKE